MSFHCRSSRRLRVLAAALLCAAGAAHANAINEWNETLIGVMVTEKSNPLLQSRNGAIVHAAVFDAVNAIDGRYAPYAKPAGAGAPHGGSLVAATATAAHRTLLALYPAQKARLDEALAKSLATVADADARDRGIASGEQAAAAVLALRAQDGASDQAVYEQKAGHGVWVPAKGVPALGVRWGHVKPWVLRSGAQFRPGPPPDISSEQFRRDYLETVALGGKSSVARTGEQTQIAMMWIASGAVLWSQVARQLAVARDLPLPETARLFALLHMAGADALIACWDAKYTYNNFRPIGAIREGTGRADLPTDPSWEPAIATPPFPAYVSGHACYGGAAATVLESAFGSHGVPAVTLRSPTAPGFERKHTRLADIAAEASNARIWGGIHWRTDQTEGDALGRKVADYALTRVLQATNGAGK